MIGASNRRTIRFEVWSAALVAAILAPAPLEAQTRPAAEASAGGNRPAYLNEPEAAYADLTLAAKADSAWNVAGEIGERVVVDLSRIGSRIEIVKAELHRLNRGEKGREVLRFGPASQLPWAIVDLDFDGDLDLIEGNKAAARTWLWSAEDNDWTQIDFPPMAFSPLGPGTRWGRIGKRRAPFLLRREAGFSGAWLFDEGRWWATPELLQGLEIDGARVFTASQSRDTGTRLFDLDGDGECEFLLGQSDRSAVWEWSEEDAAWRRLPIGLPPGIWFVDDQGRDAGLRLVDLDQDGGLDLIASNEREYSVHMFDSLATGWSSEIVRGVQDFDDASAGFAPISVRGQATGVWFDRDFLRLRNEQDRPPSAAAAADDTQEESLLAAALDHRRRAANWRRTWIEQGNLAADLDRLQTTRTQNGFARLVKNDGGTDRWHGYRGKPWGHHYLRQRTVGQALEWETAPLTLDEKSDSVALVFAGSLGYRTEPATQGFALSLGDRLLVEFDIALEPTLWTHADEGVSLLYFPTWSNEVDSAGFFYLAAPARSFMDGQPARLTVRSLGSGSSRWFAISPVEDAIALQRGLAAGLAGHGPAK